MTTLREALDRPLDDTQQALLGRMFERLAGVVGKPAGGAVHWRDELFQVGAAGQPRRSFVLIDPALEARVSNAAVAMIDGRLDALTPAIERTTGFNVRVSYAASSTLARQIANGAPAELFISADQDWMDDVASKGLIDLTTRVNLLGNTLVLVAPAKQPATLAIAPGFPLATALNGGRLAIANPDTVPAGKYGKQALTSLGVWPSVANALAPAENVRAALMYVSRGEAPLGIVYRTDALADPGVAIVGEQVFEAPCAGGFVDADVMPACDQLRQHAAQEVGVAVVPARAQGMREGDDPHASPPARRGGSARTVR